MGPQPKYDIQQAERLYLILRHNCPLGSHLASKFQADSQARQLSCDRLTIDTTDYAIDELIVRGLLTPAYETILLGFDGSSTESVISTNRTRPIPPTHYRLN